MKIRKQAKPILENKKIGYTEAALGEEGGKPVLRSRLRSGEHDGGAQGRVGSARGTGCLTWKLPSAYGF